MRYAGVAKPGKSEVKESSNFAFPLLAAYAQLLCISWAIYIIATTRGSSDFSELAAAYPIIIGGIVTPISFLSGIYYFLRYRKEPILKKIIVGLAMVTAIFGWNLLIRWW